MSEYIEIETEPGEDPAVMHFHTNLRLVEEGPEAYHSLDAMAEGSPVAQALSPIAGILHLYLDAHDMTVTRDLDIDWHLIVAEVTAVLKDFFL